MKLYELFDNPLEPRELKQTRVPKWKEGQRAREVGIPKKDPVASGMESDVFDHPKRPGSVVKITTFFGDQSGQLEIVKLAMQHPDNPFFPRIHQAKVVPINQRENRLYVEMERLQPINQAKISHMMPIIFNQIGVSPSDIKELQDLNIDDPDFTKDEHRQRVAMEVFREIFSREKMFDMADVSKNKKFKEAVQLLSHVKGAGSYMWDVHHDNIMFRLTPAGPQLVLVDPLWKQ